MEIKKSDQERFSTENSDAGKLDAVKKDSVRGMDVEKKAAEMPDREEPDPAGSVESGHGGENGERASEETGLANTDAKEANETAGTGSTEEARDREDVGNAEEARDREDAGSTEEARDREDAGSTEEASDREDAGNAEEARDRKDADGAEQAESERFDAQEEEGEDWENDDSQDDWEEESEPSKPWMMALVFLGMVAAAACICFMLWSFTHPDDQKEGNQNVFAGVTAAPGNGNDPLPDGTAPSGTGNQPLDDQGGNVASGSDPGVSDTPAPAADQNRVTTQEGRVIIFTECDDMVTPKEYVNLRTEPSTAQGEATVGCRLNNGEIAHRTGISDEMGWSRVEYNDQILYVVSSLVNVVKDGQTSE